MDRISYIADEPAVSAYRLTYGLGEDITQDHVQKHLDLEGALTEELLGSEPEQRWEVFERAYTRLYAELPWLNEGVFTPPDFAPWLKILKPNSKVFEVGSGRAMLLRFLVRHGYDCTATEITRERGEKHIADVDGIRWHRTDGVNLDNFEPAAAYDVVVSTQVLEHLHPDDLPAHFAAARRILKPGGRYIFDTPHIGTGPHDLSKVIKAERPVFMHLREYDYEEMQSLLRAAGYRRLQAVVVKKGVVVLSAWMFWFYVLVDRIIKRLKLSPARERALRSSALFMKIGPPSNIWIAAHA